MALLLPTARCDIWRLISRCRSASNDVGRWRLRLLLPWHKLPPGLIWQPFTCVRSWRATKIPSARPSAVAYTSTYVAPTEQDASDFAGREVGAVRYASTHNVRQLSDLLPKRPIEVASVSALLPTEASLTQSKLENLAYSTASRSLRRLNLGLYSRLPTFWGIHLTGVLPGNWGSPFVTTIRPATHGSVRERKWRILHRGALLQSGSAPRVPFWRAISSSVISFFSPTRAVVPLVRLNGYPRPTLCS